MRLALWCRLFVLAVLVALVIALPAMAADPHAAPAHGEKKGGLDFTGIKRYDLGIYTLIVFGLLMLILSKFAWPKIREGLEKRETNIRSALDEARKDRAEATELLARAKKELDETAGKVRAMLDEARKDAEALKATEKEKGEREAQEIKARADREAATKKDADLKEVQKQAVDLAVLIATKALRQQVTIETQHKLLNDSIAELGNSGGSKA
jgi:F-type H+-transporting ATPase subunit b